MWFMVFCNPFILRMFEQNGVAIPFCEGPLPSKAELEPPRFKDRFEANAKAFLKECMITNWGNKAGLTETDMEGGDIWSHV